MIKFKEGEINIGEQNILALSNGDFDSLAESGTIEKRKDAIGTYYYLENEADGMRFGVFISLREKRVNWVRLSWLDSPCKGWDDASGKAMMDEYRLLLNFVEKQIGDLPDNKKNRKSTWRVKWGQLEVSYEPRAYQADIFMKPE